MLDSAGAERYAFRSGESVTVEIASRPRAPLSDFVFGVGIFTPEDVCVHGTNTEIDGFLPGAPRRPRASARDAPALRPRGGDLPRRRGGPLAARGAVRLLARRVPLPGRRAGPQRRGSTGPSAAGRSTAPLAVRRGDAEPLRLPTDAGERLLLVLLLARDVPPRPRAGAGAALRARRGALRRDPARDARDGRLGHAAAGRRPLLREAAALLLVRRGLDGAPRADGARRAPAREALGGGHGPPRGRVRAAALGRADGPPRGARPRVLAPRRRPRRASRSSTRWCPSRCRAPPSPSPRSRRRTRRATARARAARSTASTSRAPPRSSSRGSSASSSRAAPSSSGRS